MTASTYRSKLVLALGWFALTCSPALTAWGTPVSVLNFSFENSTATINGADATTAPDWTNEGGSISFHKGNLVGDESTDGIGQLRLRNAGSAVRQTLAEVIDPTQMYTLRVDMSSRDNCCTGTNGLELYADNGITRTTLAKTFVVASNPNTTVARDFITAQVQAGKSQVAAFAGQTLGVRLFTPYNGEPEVFDNVRVDKNVAPNPGSATSITVPDGNFELDTNSDDQNGQWGSNGPAGVPWDGSGYPRSQGTNGVTTPSIEGLRAGQGFVWQLLPDTFVAGATYTMTLKAAARTNGNGDTRDGAFYLYRQDQQLLPNDAGTIANGNFNQPGNFLDGAIVTTVRDTVTPLNSWANGTLVYTATAADAGQRIGIAFASGDVGIFYDLITLQMQLEQAAVPEPSTYALGLLGLAGVGLVAWRKRRSM